MSGLLSREAEASLSALSFCLLHHITPIVILQGKKRSPRHFTEAGCLGYNIEWKAVSRG